jgi:hypothetical protein
MHLRGHPKTLPSDQLHDKECQKELEDSYHPDKALMRKTVLLPSQLNEDTIINFITQCVTNDWLPCSDRITFDFSTLDFVLPTGVTALANIIKWLQRRECTVYFSNYDIKLDSIAYLDDSQFFRRYFGKKLRPHAHPRDTTITLEEVLASRRHQWVERTLLPWLDGRLRIPVDKHLPEFRVCIDEVFNNIIDHSGVDIGCTFAQHYPKLKEIEIAISDFGYGIPKLVWDKLGNSMTAKDALLTAVEEGFSTKSKPSNRGSGLDTLVQNIVLHNKGEILIQSHDGALLCSLMKNGVTYHPYDLDGIYPGTLIKITLRTDTIPRKPFNEEEFLWDF